MSCPGCGDPADGDRFCWKCGYARAMEAAHDRFAPLKRALERRLETPVEVWQTGGMTMCLAVPCGRKDSDGYLIDYVLFADWAWASDDDGSSFGKYRDGEYIDSALWKGCAYRPENAEQIAEWAAPLILRWASSLLTHGA